MPRYIDADYLDELITQLNHEGRGITRNEYKMVDNILFEFPTADVVQVVRCKECKFYNEAERMCNDTNGFDRYWKPTDFCSYGKRREDE